MSDQIKSLITVAILLVITGLLDYLITRLQRREYYLAPFLYFALFSLLLALFTLYVLMPLFSYLELI